MSQRKAVISLLAITVVAVGIGIVIGTAVNQGAEAAGGKVSDPNGVAPDRYVYYPGTEALGPDEMRIIACGTGMPAARRGQAASCWVFELGNGDKFLFDVGTGSMANVMSLMIPSNMLTKVFGGDTFPNTWFIKYAKDADIVIHEAMLTAGQLRKYYNQPPSRTIMMNTDIRKGRINVNDANARMLKEFSEKNGLPLE